MNWSVMANAIAPSEPAMRSANPSSFAENGDRHSRPGTSCCIPQAQANISVSARKLSPPRSSVWGVGGDGAAREERADGAYRVDQAAVAGRLAGRRGRAALRDGFFHDTRYKRHDARMSPAAGRISGEDYNYDDYDEALHSRWGPVGTGTSRLLEVAKKSKSGEDSSPAGTPSRRLKWHKEEDDKLRTIVDARREELEEDRRASSARRGRTSSACTAGTSRAAADLALGGRGRRRRKASCARW